MMYRIDKCWYLLQHTKRFIAIMSTSSPSPIDVLKVMDDFDLEIMLLLLQVMQASMHVITSKILVAMGHVKKESTSRENPLSLLGRH